MITRPKATIQIPTNSAALRQEIEPTFRDKWQNIDFAFVEGEIDSPCRILAIENCDSQAVAQAIHRALKRIERGYR
jgi:hypothetical protein